MKPSYTALIPFGIFLFVFALLTAVYNDGAIIKDNFPLFAAFIAIIASFFTFRNNETLPQKIDVFIQGSSQPIVILMCYIFFLSTVFTTILEQTGGIASAVNLSLHIIPAWCVLPGIFTVASLFSFTIGTSMGTIAAFMPIAGSIATHLTLNPSIMAATIVCGAMFGDNLSILSDTSIAAVNVSGASMTKRLALNTKIAVPAFIISIIILAWQNYNLASNLHLSQLSPITYLDFITIIPYLVTFYLALTGLDILIVLVGGILLALGIGLGISKITFLQAINLFFDGFYASKGMVNVVVLVLLLSGLSAIITHNGGLEYLIEKLKNKVANASHAKLAMLCLVTIVNITIAINTIAVLVCGPVAKKIGDDFNIDSTQTACILDIGSCVTQGILPYAPQLLLAASMAHVSAISLLPYLYYQYLLGISLLIVIAYRNK